MSLDALSWAFNLDLPNSGAKLTLLALANFANEHGEAYPSQKAISAKTCLSDRAIRRHLVTLEELGIIFRKPRKRANGSYSSDLFQIHVGGGFADGKFLRRPNWPEVENEHIQRPNRPAAKLADGQKQQRPAAKLAAPERSLNTTINKLHTTEVNRTTAHENPELEKRVCVDLIFPPLPEQTRSALFRIIEPCDPSDAQVILDEVSGTLAKGTCKNPITLAMSLVKAMTQGKFYPSLGVSVAQNRAKAEDLARVIAATRKPENLDPLACQKGQEVVDAIRTRRKRWLKKVDDGIPKPRQSG